MTIKNKLLPILLISVVAGGMAVIMLRSGAGAKKVAVMVTVPQLTAVARKGEAVFNGKCAECHGENASGTDNGPPLIHIIYEPNHHGDISFVRAAKMGVKSHHWPFGDMPPVEGIKEREVAMVINYVRELQRANGIF